MCPTQSPNDGYVNWDIPEPKKPKKQAFKDLMIECPWPNEYQWGRIRMWKWRLLHWFGRRKHIHLRSPAKGITYTACMSKDAILRSKVENRFARYSTCQQIFDSFGK